MAILIVILNELEKYFHSMKQNIERFNVYSFLEITSDYISRKECEQREITDKSFFLNSWLGPLSYLPAYIKLIRLD